MLSCRILPEDMKLKRRPILVTMLLAGALILAGCHSGEESPKGLLSRYFSASVRQDYGAVYLCYYDAYKAKVSKEDFIRHRKEASVLQSYVVKSIAQQGDKAQADVELTFAPSQKLKRDRPVTASVKEEMVREKGEWKIKVW